MYSVLIQNQKTIQQFQEYYPLFLEMFSKDKMGLCRWVESGHSVDTALPGLAELIEGKEEWRAIIVRYEDENDMSRFKSVPGNIYDFYESRKYASTENGRKKHLIEESPIPLVRLTQMLGEVPAPELDFEPQIISEDGKAPQRIFITRRSEKDDKAYQDLVRKYKFDGKKPDDIILITFVNIEQKREKNVAEDAWVTNVEINTSNFGRNNRYSSNTRFIQYPYLKEGRTRKNADTFNFWTCVMLLASNDIDPSSLQAFRLYNVHADMDKDSMARCFQDKYDELRGCRFYVENEIRDDIEKKLNEKHPEPGYRMSIPVKMDIPMDSNTSVDTSEFHITPRSAGGELKKWEGLSSVAEGSLEDIFRRQDRILDESAAIMRHSSSLTEEEVTPLNKYEQFDMDEELSRTFDEILKTQNRLSGTRNLSDERIGSMSASIREYIRGRVSSAAALEVGIGIILISVLMFGVAFAFPKNSNPDYAIGVLTVFATFGIILLLSEAVTLLLHRRELVSRIDKYNETLEENLNVLTSDLGIYSKFISNIVSFARGKSFLHILRHKTFDLEMEYDYLQRHLSEINLMMDKVSKWAEAYYVPVNQDRNIEGDYFIDIEVRPRYNKLYALEYNKEYEAPLNVSGDMVYSPVSFVERLVIKREELYEK